MHKRPLLLLICTIFAMFPPASIAEQKAALRALENRLLPYFEYYNREHPNSPVPTALQPPSTADLMKIVRNWNFLSVEFRKVYAEAIEIPADFRMYKSPGFGTEVYYTTTGVNAPALEDTWHADSINWRNKVSAPNGIPDYVDEVAYAMDSAWSMEIERFGFPAPYPYTSTRHSSANYKVKIIKPLYHRDYGIAYPVAPDESGIGFSSLFIIRNEWNGWDKNDIINYETYPEKAVRITCAHEFFHSIQYRMVHNVINNVYLDDFPISWLEGTAVLMEELAWPEVNDFTQYGVDYFASPSRFTFFDRIYDESVYSNTLICQYIYNHPATNTEPIDFFKSIMTENMANPVSFEIQLTSVAARHAVNWATLLNSFHAASFYTENSAVKNRFLDDAELLPRLRYSQGEGLNKVTITKTVRPWSVQFTSYLRNNATDSTLSIDITPSAPARTEDYAASCILHRKNRPSEDTTIEVETSGSNTGSTEIDSWWKWDEAIVVISNGMASDNLEVSLRFDANMHHPGQTPITPASNPGDMTYFLINGRKIPITRNFPKKNAAHTTDNFTSQGVIIEKSTGKPRLLLNVR